jgi:peptidoglycan/xylan/chitin deacetylase (PgdA/CDA1 family)
MAGEATLHLPQGKFAEQLDLLSELAEVIPLSRALEPPSGTRPRVVITWDDAYLGAVTVGVAEAARRRLPATLFVPPGCLGSMPFWWDQLAEVHRGAIPSDVRNRALHECAGRTDLVMATLGPSGPCPMLPAHAMSATETELRSAAAQPGITVASHGWSHANLAALEADELTTELIRSRDWLTDRFPSALTSISYPYGVESEAVRDGARAAGYTTAFRVSGGWFPPAPGDPMALPRLNIPANLSLDGFALRLAGVFCR